MCKHVITFGTVQYSCVPSFFTIYSNVGMFGKVILMFVRPYILQHVNASTSGLRLHVWGVKIASCKNCNILSTIFEYVILGQIACMYLYFIYVCFWSKVYGLNTALFLPFFLCSAVHTEQGIKNIFLYWLYYWTCWAQFRTSMFDIHVFLVTYKYKSGIMILMRYKNNVKNCCSFLYSIKI